MGASTVCLVSDWEPDRSFLEALERGLQRRGYATFLVWPHNLDETVAAVGAGTLRPAYFVDRATNTSPEFRSLTSLLEELGVASLDPPWRISWAADKATMHREFQRAGIQVPRTVILQPYAEQEALPGIDAEIAALGVPFVIKPASTTGGGIGVFDEARSRTDVQSVRQQYPSDRYLLQARVLPLESGGRRHWFRSFYVCGRVRLSWWHDRSHLYETVTNMDVMGEGGALRPLRSVMIAIARVCGLKLFSSEIAATRDDGLVVVDYVNETPDLRPRSIYPDGVPDEVVQEVVCALVDWIDATLLARGAGRGTGASRLGPSPGGA
jgi:glutathione synthase/RimK-type ligase-like ATP-grasp enzyme